MAPVISALQRYTYTLSICNRTDHEITAQSTYITTEKASQAPKSTQDIVLRVPFDHSGISGQSFVDLLGPNGILICSIPIRLPMGPSTKWKPISTTKSFRILSRSLSPSIHQLLIFAQQRDCSTFLTSLDDNLCLTSLCIPGTHDSLSLYGWPISACQSSDSSITKQLHDGIRYLDIRLAPKGLAGKERLLAYHGITDQRIEFGAVLNECFDFLNGIGRKETIIMSLKQESGLQDLFINLLFTKYVDQSPASPDGKLRGGRNRWFLEDRVPTLGEARGKIVMLSRFVIDRSYGFPGGISPPIWPNNQKAPFEYRLRSSKQRVQTQDWYSIGTLSHIPEKMSLINQVCQEAGTDNGAFALNYCNGCTFPFALPPAVAKGFLDDGTKTQEERNSITNLVATQGVNSSLRDHIIGVLFQSPHRNKIGAVDGLKVTWALDFYNEPKGAADLIQLLIEADF